MNKTKFIKQAKLPKGAYTPDLSKVTAKYAAKPNPQAIALRMQKSGWSTNQDTMEFQLIQGIDIVYKVDADSIYQMTNPHELKEFLQKVYESLGWDEEKIKSEITYILTGETL